MAARKKIETSKKNIEKSTNHMERIHLFLRVIIYMFTFVTMVVVLYQGYQRFRRRELKIIVHLASYLAMSSLDAYHLPTIAFTGKRRKSVSF